MGVLRSTETVAVQTEGPAATLEGLYRAEYVGMVRLAYTLVGSNVEAEEIVQNSFVEISQRLDEIRRPGAYLRTVVVSRCRSVLRRRRLTHQHPPARPPDLPPEAESLWDVLEQLPEHQRIAVVLRYHCGYRASEIAARGRRTQRRRPRHRRHRRPRGRDRLRHHDPHGRRRRLHGDDRTAPRPAGELTPAVAQGHGEAMAGRSGRIRLPAIDARPADSAIKSGARRADEEA